MIEQGQGANSEDFWEPEMPAIWLVQDTEAFGTKGKTTDRDRPLNLRLTYQEWLAIFLDALGVDKNGYEKWAAKKVVLGQASAATILTELDEEIPEFPMLSRIRGPYHDVVFEFDEIERLHKECLRAQRSTSNVLALHGLEKLIHAYDQARQLRLSIYFVSN